MTEIAVCRTAEQHVSRAQELLAQAESGRPESLALAVVHLDAARTITAMEEARAAKQARLDAKGTSAGFMDMLSKALPSSEQP